MKLLLTFGIFWSSFAQRSLQQLNAQLSESSQRLNKGLSSGSASSTGFRAEKMVASVEGDLEYACQKYYWTEDCTGDVVHMASKKYNGCYPYLFEVDALGKYFDMLGGVGHCLDNTCTDCEVSSDILTADLLVGGKNPTCRSRKYLGLSDETTPTWNFHPGPCPNMCAQFYGKHPGCDENYDGDLPCEPTQEEIDYAPQCFKVLSLATAASNTEWCPDSAAQRCRMQCSNPTCSEGQCALRDGRCCDYTCTENPANTESKKKSKGKKPTLARRNERLRKANIALLNALESLAN